MTAEVLRQAQELAAHAPEPRRRSSRSFRPGQTRPRWPPGAVEPARGASSSREEHAGAGTGMESGQPGRGLGMRLGSRRHSSGALSLDGRVAVVTGAARGVGESTAWALSRRGARVALLGLEGDRLRRLAEDLPGPAAGFPVDVTDADALAAVAQDVREVLGVVSVVVANASVAIGGPLLDCEPEDWRRVIEVNIVGSALTARCFLPDLLRSHGYYLQVASLPALAPAPFLTAYRASKSGVEALAHALRAEITHRGVDVGIAYLHWADTTLIRHADQTAVFQELRSHMPWPASVNQDPPPTPPPWSGASNTVRLTCTPRRGCAPRRWSVP
ncbi:short-chain dehydrogenase/reductase [Streptomyces erythrochromogenes]|uniref:short-chain dehydrogenase/reductase n=1 Tax=Streptomyces erythrochromogenes TaxID=285574 RepID=UPI00362877C1